MPEGHFSSAVMDIPGVDAPLLVPRAERGDVHAQWNEFAGAVSETQHTLDQLRVYLESMRQRLAELN